MNITDPAVQTNPAWKAGVLRASDLFGQAAYTFDAQIAPGTNPMLGRVADTTVSSLRTSLSRTRRSTPRRVILWRFSGGPEGNDWLCR